jgi:hypothetical protein
MIVQGGFEYMAVGHLWLSHFHTCRERGPGFQSNGCQTADTSRLLDMMYKHSISHQQKIGVTTSLICQQLSITVKTGMVSLNLIHSGFSTQFKSMRINVNQRFMVSTWFINPSGLGGDESLQTYINPRPSKKLSNLGLKLFPKLHANMLNGS